MKSEQASANLTPLRRCALPSTTRRVKTGVFGEMMDVALVNGSPVTLVVDRARTWRDNTFLRRRYPAWPSTFGSHAWPLFRVQLDSIGVPSAASSWIRMLPQPPLVATCASGQRARCRARRPRRASADSSSSATARPACRCSARVCSIFVRYDSAYELAKRRFAGSSSCSASTRRRWFRSVEPEATGRPQKVAVAALARAPSRTCADARP